MPTAFDNTKGFTLIEVIVALAIVSIAMISVVDSINKHTHVSSELEKKVLSWWVASNVIAELRHNAKTEKLRNRKSSENVKMGGHQWRAQINVRKTDVEKVHLVTVEVIDPSAKDKKVLASMTTAVTDPT